jgi:PadR family transcriptional regulator PadR
MGRDGILGGFEEQVLVAIGHLGTDAYGMTIRREIAQRTGQAVSIGAVYSSIDRLEAKGLVTSRFAPGDPDRRGGPRRFVELRPAGADALRVVSELRARMWEGLDLDQLAGRRGRV